jgi:hypothetical protein
MFKHLPTNKNNLKKKILDKERLKIILNYKGDEYDNE